MKLASLAFVTCLSLAHLEGDFAKTLSLPLSMIRDGESWWVGYLLFGLLLLIAGLMLNRLRRDDLAVDACLVGVVAAFLFLVAVTPSQDGFHNFGSFVVLAVLFGYYAAVLRGESAAWMFGHLAVPILLLFVTQFHSYGLWQKSLIVYFLLVINVHNWLLSRGGISLSLTNLMNQGRHRGRGKAPRRRVVYMVDTSRSWSRKSPRGDLTSST